MLGAATPFSSSSLAFVTIFTLLGRPCRRAPRAIASLEQRSPIAYANSVTFVKGNLLAVPQLMTQALPSLIGLPSEPSDMRFVSGPPDLVNRVISKVGSSFTALPPFRTSSARHPRNALREPRPEGIALGCSSGTAVYKSVLWPPVRQRLSWWHVFPEHDNPCGEACRCLARANSPDGLGFH